MVLHVELDSFFVGVERRRRPELIGRPIVIGGRPGGRGTVAAASREARKHGIRAGMPLAQAALRCPEAIFVDGAFDDAFAAAQRIDELLRRETAAIQWESIDEVFVGVPAAHAADQAIGFAERVHRAIGDLGFDASCGLARSKVVAKVASSLGRPSGVVHVLDGYEARFLSPLKIELLPGIDLALARRLRAAGVRRLGQLARLSDAELARLGVRAAPALARKAAGIDPSQIRRTALPPAPLVDRDLPDVTNDPAVVAAAIAREAARAARDLRSRSVFARSLTLRLRFADGRVDSRTMALTEPTALDDALSSAALQILPRMWSGDRLLRGASVSCSGLVAGAGELFPLQRA